MRPFLSFIERELKDRGLRKNEFAQSISEHPRILSAIAKGGRGMNTQLAMKIEKALGFDEGYLMTLPVFFDIREEKRRRNVLVQPDLSRFRRVIFWVTVIEKIDWQRQKRAIVRRISERSNAREKRRSGASMVRLK